MLEIQQIKRIAVTLVREYKKKNKNSYRDCISQVLSHSCCWSWCTSIIFLFVNDSWGSLYSVYLSNTLSISVLAYWYSLLLLLKMMRAISQSHSTDSSYAFFITPNFLLLKVTWKFVHFKPQLSGFSLSSPLFNLGGVCFII